MMTNPNVSILSEDNAVPPPAPSDAQLASAWFDEPPPSTRRPSTVPPPSVVGEFLGDEVADGWLR